jgi:hypothetical protein
MGVGVSLPVLGTHHPCTRGEVSAEERERVDAVFGVWDGEDEMECPWGIVKRAFGENDSELASSMDERGGEVVSAPNRLRNGYERNPVRMTMGGRGLECNEFDVDAVLECVWDMVNER